MRRAVFLDRDGVINKVIVKNDLPFSPPTFEQLEILPGVKESVSILHNLNFLCLVVTNQPDVSRGKIKKEIVIKMNNYLKNELKLDDFFICYHDDKDKCECRKPKSGLLFEAAKKWNVNIKKSYMIGDRWKDVEAGKSAGCKTIFLDCKYKDTKTVESNFITDSLLDAVHLIENDADIKIKK